MNLFKTKEGRKKRRKRTKDNAINLKVTNMVGINPTISIITLNVIAWNTVIKRQRLSEWVKKKVKKTPNLMFIKNPF